MCQIIKFNLEEYLIQNDWQRYFSNDINFRYSDYFYQKAIKYEKGVRYFIEIVHYSEILKQSLPPILEAWTVYVSFAIDHRKRNDYIINHFDPSSEDDINIMFGELMRVWQAIGSPYYELQKA